MYWRQYFYLPVNFGLRIFKSNGFGTKSPLLLDSWVRVVGLFKVVEPVDEVETLNVGDTGCCDCIVCAWLLDVCVESTRERWYFKNVVFGFFIFRFYYKSVRHID